MLAVLVLAAATVVVMVMLTTGLIPSVAIVIARNGIHPVPGTGPGTLNAWLDKSRCTVVSTQNTELIFFDYFSYYLLYTCKTTFAHPYLLMLIHQSLMG